ncbi:MAG: hypothetical protein ACR2P0_07040, partial [Acidimicrobiales bacterium]
FERREGQFIGAIGINTIVTFGCIMVALVVGAILMAPDIRVAPLLAVVVAVAVIVPLLFLPVSKTLWAAIDVVMDPPDPSETPGLEFVIDDA